MSEKENHDEKRNFSRQHRGKKAATIRYHNPGTSRQVRLLSSVVVVPPRHRSMPIITPSTSDNPRFVPTIPWYTPNEIDVPPVEPVWRRTRSLIPVPEVDYRYGYEIFAGDAYGPVPLYVDRNRPWVLQPLELPPPRTIHFYREDISDPRQHDFRVEVVRQDLRPSTSQGPAITTPPKPVNSAPQESSDIPSATTTQKSPTLSPPSTPLEPPTLPPASAPRGKDTNSSPKDAQTAPPPPVVTAPRRRRRSRLIIIG